MTFEYRIATAEDLEQLWAYNIAANPDDPRWVRWKDEYIGYNQRGQAVTFAIIADGEAVGEGTLLLCPECKAVLGHPELADGMRIGNVNALRIRKAYEGHGHISCLMQMMETYAHANGLQALTIGVDAFETRNLAIYLHWGYDEMVCWKEEDGMPVLYYRKDLV